MNKHCGAASAFAFFALASSSLAADINVLASGATREVVEELVPAFEKASGHKVGMTWAGGADIKKRLAAGERYDALMTSGPDIADQAKEGRVVAGSEVGLMKTGIGVAVKEGAPTYDVSSSDSLKAALLAAKSIGYSTGPSGLHVVTLAQQMGIEAQVKDKLKQVPSGVNVGSIVAKGEAEIGFQQVSELIHYPGVTYLGPLPHNIQKITQYSGGLQAGARQPDAAKEFLKYLASPSATPAIKHHGMEPG